MPQLSLNRKLRAANLLKAREAAKRDDDLQLDAERALVVKDYATRARQQTDATLYGTVHCELQDYFTIIEQQVYFAQVHIGAAPLPPPLQREHVEDIAKGYGVDALRIHRPEVSAGDRAQKVRMLMDRVGLTAQQVNRQGEGG